MGGAGRAVTDAESPSYPFLILPSPREGERSRGRPTPRRGNLRGPSAARQAERLGPKFQALQDSFDTQRAELQVGISGAEPERVLVLETVGPVEDFINAARRIEGLEFLGEFDEADIPPDEHFYNEESPDQALGGTIYLVMTNRQAMEQLFSLWQRFIAAPDDPFERGLNRFRELFNWLYDVRPWGPEDRLRDTGILEDWRHRVDEEHQTVPAEIELWFRDEGADRRQVEEELRQHIAEVHGTAVTAAVIPAIRYHAVLAHLPVSAITPLFESVDAISLVRSDAVMFLRPTGQGVGVPLEEGGEGLPEDGGEPDASASQAEPLVALLDGVPLEGHAALAGRLIIDDPDEYTSNAEGKRRRHGTAMASLLLHGDLNAPGGWTARRLYVRPILVPEPIPEWMGDTGRERIPDDVLPVDLIHRALRRIYEGEGSQGPVAPTVRIINLSVADDAAPFTTMLSPWARLLDWASWNYGALIVVSAGNHLQEIEVDRLPDEVDQLSATELQRETLGALAEAIAYRRLLPPSEGVNVLSVGACPADEAVMNDTAPLRELISSAALPAPFSPLGPGFRRSIKPEVLMPGGRLLYERRPGGPPSRFKPSEQPLGPSGNLVASPIGPAGQTEGRAYLAGTSNGAALASRLCGELHDSLEDLRNGGGAAFLEDERVLMTCVRALMVHGASFDEGAELLRAAVGDRVKPRRFREYASRFLGYGRCDPDRMFGSTEQRATMLGGGTLGEDEAGVFDIPLPPSLSGEVGHRRLTVTLAWLTPTNPRHRRYRRARLWFDPPRDQLRVRRQEADHNAVRRGTVQHEVLEGRQATAFADGDMIRVHVNCAADAGQLPDRIPYALAVTLEVAPEVDVDVFTEIRDRIRPVIPIRSES